MCYKIWTFKVDVLFLQHHEALKCINHSRKIVNLMQPDEFWFTNVMQLFGL